MNAVKFHTLILILSVLASCSGPDFSVIERETRDGYECCLIEYEVSPGEKVRSFLLIPENASPQSACPGLVLLHDHGARFDIGKEKLARPFASAPENIRLSSAQWVKDNFDGVYFADSLASLGYAVIVPDMLYWGDRSTGLCRQWSRTVFCGDEGDAAALKKQVYEGQRDIYDSLYAEGTVWAEKTLAEDDAAAGILAGLGCVDKNRIGVFGWSMGAHRAWLLAAFGRHVSAGVSVCWMTMKEAMPVPYKASDYAMLIPHLREAYDFPDIAYRLAPKRYLFLNGRNDKLFPARISEQAFEKMQSIYSEAGAEGRLETEFFEGGHHCGKEVQKRVVDFLEKTVPLH